MHFLPANEESEFSIYAICSSCFTSFWSQDQALETELLGHIIVYEDVPHWDPVQQCCFHRLSLSISKRQAVTALTYHSSIQNILQGEPVVSKHTPQQTGR